MAAIFSLWMLLLRMQRSWLPLRWLCPGLFDESVPDFPGITEDGVAFVFGLLQQLFIAELQLFHLFPGLVGGMKRIMNGGFPLLQSIEDRFPGKFPKDEQQYQECQCHPEDQAQSRGD